MIFLASCAFLYSSYQITIQYLNKYDKFKRSKRKTYIVKNIVKSFVLVLLVISCMYCVFPYRSWHNDSLRTIASAYVANDFVALMTCKLPWSTMMHHTVTCIFLVFAQFVDFNQSIEAQMLFYYSFFSACTFFVNLYLGMRLLGEYNSLKTICKYGYPLFLSINWCIQLYHLPSLQLWYVGLLLVIVFDDVVLVHWLWK